MFILYWVTHQVSEQITEQRRLECPSCRTVRLLMGRRGVSKLYGILPYQVTRIYECPACGGHSQPIGVLSRVLLLLIYGTIAALLGVGMGYGGYAFVELLVTASGSSVEFPIFPLMLIVPAVGLGVFVEVRLVRGIRKLLTRKLVSMSRTLGTEV